jgi:hypothetical protein
MTVTAASDDDDNLVKTNNCEVVIKPKTKPMPNLRLHNLDK